jgi:hypothetical protein
MKNETRKDYTSLYLWLGYLVLMALLMAVLFLSCTTQRVNPADMKYNKETVNPVKGKKPLKLKTCN